MDTTVSYYVRKKVKDDFDKCNWTDGVGKKFEDVALTEMLKVFWQTLAMDKWGKTNESSSGKLPTISAGR